MASRIAKAGIAAPPAAGLLWIFSKTGSWANRPSEFMPHGYCYLWDPWIIWLHVISDGLITLSYYAIPVILVYFIRKNKDLSFNGIFWMFGGSSWPAAPPTSWKSGMSGTATTCSQALLKPRRPLYP